MESSLADIPFEPSRPPAAAIPGALRQTELALATMKDSDRFEDLVVMCLQDLDPTLRPTGGSGDRQRDAVTGGLFLTEETVLTISLEKDWPGKVRRDLAGLKDNPPAPKHVIAVSNRRTRPGTRRTLQDEAPAKYGLELQVLDQRFLALRLLRQELLPVREELLGLPFPAVPVALEAEAFAENLATTASRIDSLHGRDAELRTLLDSLKAPGTTVIEGAGGIGKTRLAIEAAGQTDARTLFVDDRSQISRRELPVELAGTDPLVLVVDNAHRRPDLRELVGLLHQRTGPTNLILIARPGFQGHLMDSVDGSALGPLAERSILTLRPLEPKAIGDIVRNAEPELSYAGAVDRIVDSAQGNPLIALLAHSVAVEGGALDQLGQAEILAQHTHSLVASLIDRLDATAHEINELLAIVAALTFLDLDEAEITAAVTDLSGINESQLSRLLHDFADAGIVSQTGKRFAVSPDILSGHILWSSFFAIKPRVALQYEAVWDALSRISLDRLCDGLGGLPSGSIGADHPLGRFIARQMLDRANEGEQVLALTRAVAPALPWLAAEIVDAALEHLPAERTQRGRAIVAAAEALARTPHFDQGWPRQLAVAAAAFAPGDDEPQADDAPRKRVVEDLTQVYRRVPIDVGPEDARILAAVQHEMARSTKTFWRRRRNDPGTAEAVAIAARQMLTVTFDNSYTTAEADDVVHLRGFSLPASRWTREGLFTGTRLFAETIALLTLTMQIEQAQALDNLVRAARGLEGRFGARPSDEMAALAREAQGDLVARLSALPDLPIVLRAALEDALGQIWHDDADLDEFHDLLSIGGGRRRRDAWEEPAASQRVQDMAKRVSDADDSVEVVDRWAGWLAEAQESGKRDWSTNIAANALRVAATMDPPRFANVLDEALACPGPLTPHLVGALVVVLNEAEDADARIARLVASEHEEVRAAAARAVGASSLGARLDVLSGLVADPCLQVRRAARDALIYGDGLTAAELNLALQACRPTDIDGLTHVLWRVDQGQPGTAGLAIDQIAPIREITLNAATEDRLDGYDLAAIFRIIREFDSRIPIDFARSRVEHQLADRRRDGLLTFGGVDSLPNEIRGAIRAAATKDDLAWILDRIEDTDRANPGHGTLRDLLEWVDDGPVVTERIKAWFASENEAMVYEAQLVLDHRLPCADYRERARALLVDGMPAEIEDAIIHARQPRFWSGTRHRFWRALRDEFAQWTDDEDVALADLGQAGVEYYEHRLHDEPGDDPGDCLSDEDEDDA